MGDKAKEHKNGIKMVQEILENVSKDKGLYLNYVKICYGALRLLRNEFPEKIQLPIKVEDIFNNYGIKIRRDNLNEFMEGGDLRKINQIIGKISKRPDIFSGKSKTTVYVDENESPAMINYALAHELCHLILNYGKDRYRDDFCTMPMLPIKIDELVADTFAVFLLIPFDIFLNIFKQYVKDAKEKGNTPIRTKEWLNHLSAEVAVPYDYVACAYQQIRHVAYVMFSIHIAKTEEERKACEEMYGSEALKLYELVKDEVDEEVIQDLFQ